MTNSLKSTVVTITGGTGSFGSTMVKQLLSEGVSEVRVFSRDETKQDQMRNALKDSRIKFIIGDVRDQSSIEPAIDGSDYVFHAAALKQVPSCEFFPMQAVATNITGSSNVLNSAIKYGIKGIVCLSTDKAVYPINAMGISKAMMEKIMVAQSRLCDPKKTVLCATRYGNVMGSRGSVIPLFVKQLLAKEPLTITDPTMTRFLMSLEDSVNLVMYAFTHAQPGDIFVQKAPAATISDLATALQQLLKTNLPVNIIGTRHGEKLYESLVSREEMARAEEREGYYRIAADTRDLNYDKYFTQGEVTVSENEDYTSHNTQRLDIEGIKKTLLPLDLIQKAMHA